MLYSKTVIYFLVKKPEFINNIFKRFIEYIDTVEMNKKFPEFPRPTSDEFRQRILDMIEENNFVIDNIFSYKVEEEKERQGYAYDEKTTYIDMQTSELLSTSIIFSRGMMIAKEFLDFVRVETRDNYHYVNLAKLLHNYCNVNINRINKYLRSVG